MRSTLLCNAIYKHMFIFVHNNSTHDLRHDYGYGYNKMIIRRMITQSNAQVLLDNNLSVLFSFEFISLFMTYLCAYVWMYFFYV